MKKKEAAPWYIAATHYLTAGFVPGLLCGAIGGLLVHFFTSGNPFLSQTIIACLFPIAAYIGVRYSAKYVKKAYVLTSAPVVAVIATVYYAFIQVFGVLALIYFATKMLFPAGIILIMVIAIAQGVCGLAVFYFTSRKCIENDPTPTSLTGPYVPSGLFPESYAPPAVVAGMGVEKTTSAAIASPAAPTPIVAEPAAEILSVPDSWVTAQAAPAAIPNETDSVSPPSVPASQPSPPLSQPPPPSIPPPSIVPPPAPSIPGPHFG